MKRIDSSYRCSTAPLKWKKHLTLVDWGLREEENLIGSINRYLICDYTYCLDDIKNELDLCGNTYTFIIKLVYRQDFLKLPNIVVSSKEELERARQVIGSYRLSDFAEIWYCKNLTKNNKTVFGRMLFNNDLLFPSRCAIRYEMVWDSSARKIEEYPAIKCSFIALDRSNWNAQPTIAQFNDSQLSVEEMMSESESIISNISRYTSQIIDFASFVFSCGCNHLCLEFSCSNGVFGFIDWDSDNDIKVLTTQNNSGGCT